MRIGPRGAEIRPTARVGGFRINPGAIARKTVLALTGVNDATITYRGSLSSAANGITGDGFSLFSGVRGTSPSLGYRLGFDRSIPLNLRLGDAAVGIRQEDILGSQHDFEGRTTLQPFSSLRIGLTWRTGWQSNDRIQYDFTPEGNLVGQAPIQSGSGESSVLALGGSYDALLSRHRNRFLDDLNRGETDSGFLVSEALTRTGLASDFRSEFGRGLGSYGPSGLFALPMPSWDLNYSGLSKWPLLQRLTQQVTLRHGYFATSRGAYASSLLTVDERLRQAQSPPAAGPRRQFPIHHRPVVCSRQRRHRPGDAHAQRALPASHWGSNRPGREACRPMSTGARATCIHSTRPRHS